MTLEEKAMLVTGTGMFFEIPDSVLAAMSGGPGQMQVVLVVLVAQVPRVVIPIQILQI